MTSTKELPPSPNKGFWYQEGDRASARLIYEAYVTKNLFPLHTLKKVKNQAVPIWDKSEFQIRTHELKLRRTRDRNYSLGWDIRFSMLGSEHLCRPDEIWTLKIFFQDFPTPYPHGDMVAVVLDQNNHPLKPPEKNRKPERIIEENVYPMWCVDWAQAKDRSELNGAVLATESILLLRLYLHSKRC